MGYAVKEKMNGVGLLLMLRDITHKQDESVQSTLAYVKMFLEWTLTYQGNGQSNTDYYTLFLSRIDTIRPHGREPGFHKGVVQKYLTKILEKKEKRGRNSPRLGLLTFYRSKRGYGTRQQENQNVRNY